jgi:hypothetical protein
MRLGVTEGHVSIVRIRESHECIGIVSKYVKVNKAILIDCECQPRQTDRDGDRLTICYYWLMTYCQKNVCRVASSLVRTRFQSIR